MDSTLREYNSTTTTAREVPRTIAESEMKTYEDDEFDRIERENKPKSSGMDCCTYDCNQGRNCPIRNKTIEEVAQQIDKLPFGDTTSSFATFIRNMKS